MPPNGSAFNGRPGAEPRWNHKDRSARPVRCSAGLSRRRAAVPISYVHRFITHFSVDPINANLRARCEDFIDELARRCFRLWLLRDVSPAHPTAVLVLARVRQAVGGNGTDIQKS